MVAFGENDTSAAQSVTLRTDEAPQANDIIAIANNKVLTATQLAWHNDRWQLHDVTIADRGEHQQRPRTHEILVLDTSTDWQLPY